MPRSRRKPEGRSPRRPGRSGRLARWLLVGGACLIGLLYYRPVRAYFTTQHTLAQRTAEVRTLAAQKATLEQRVAATASATGSALVQEARRLGLVKPGERLYIVKGIKRWLHDHSR